MKRSDAQGDMQHEVFFEEGLTPLKHRSLFIGRSISKRRFLVSQIFIGMVLTVLAGRAAWMQVHLGDEFQAQAEANRLRTTALMPRRGVILDRQGRILADNIPRFQVMLTPFNLPRDPAEVENEVSQAARLLGLSVNDLMPLATATGTARDEETIIAQQVAYEDAMAFAIDLPNLPGFSLEVAARRRYPWSADIMSLSHVLGYVARVSPEEYASSREKGYRRADDMGKAGLERTHEAELRGQLGARVSEVDAHGRIQTLVAERDAIDGQELKLSLDIDLQRATEQALRKEMALAHVQRGAAIAMDPRDGSILATVSWPSYDNNQFSGGVSTTVYQTLINDPEQPLFPRAWAGTYPSGSTVKIVISAAALAEHIITPQTTVLSTGGLLVGGHMFPDWKAGGHGLVNVRSAIAWSVNTFYYTIGGGYESFVGLGVEKLTHWFRVFGLGSKTGIDLPNEGTGLVPGPDWKQEKKGERWYVGDTYNLSIGQGDLLVTPLQVAAYTAEIANGGFKVVPRLEKATSTAIGERLAPADAVEVVRKGMRDNVTYGSGRALAGLAMPVAGKTGTAQWSSTKATHAWFTAFAPYEKPEVVVTVLLEEGGEGSSVSVPVARDMLNAWWELRNARGGAF
ncbi:MAG: penicillin-binding protein 2 [Candidatus Uhrbacteria bacterium]